MYRRERPMGIGDFLDNHAEGAVFGGIIGIVLSFFWLVGFGVYTDIHNSDLEDNAAFSKLMYSYGNDANDRSAAMQQKRQEFARQFVQIKQETNKRSGKGFTYLAFSGDQWKQVKAVAKTGNPVNVNLKKKDFDVVFTWPWLRIELLIFFTLLGLGALLQYSDEDHNHRLADLPWLRVWPLILTLVLGPVFWIVMLVSAVLLIFTPRREARDDNVYSEEDEYPIYQDAHENGRVLPDSYPSSPQAARSTYITLRTKSARKHRKRRFKDVDFDIERCTERARSLSEDIRATQGELNKLRAERQRLNDSIDANLEAVTETTASEEFDRIMQLPGVLAVNVVNDGLRITVRATHEYKGTVYDLGDWRINISPDSTYLEATEIRSGIRSSWGRGYPVYRMGDNTFCFGDRQDVIDEHMNKGQYLEALAVAVECLSSINQGERKDVPYAFYPVSA